MGVFVVTSCTSRKRLPGLITPSLVVGDAAVDSRKLSEVARAWREQLQRSGERTIVRKLYLGRTMVDANAVADSLPASLFVVSAGLGLVQGDELVPAYSLTVADGPDSVLPALARCGATTKQWWTMLNGSPSPLTSVVVAHKPARVLMALPQRYIDMIADDLERMPAYWRNCFRIFTSPASRSSLPAAWQEQVMPYDDRLDGIGSPRRGTRTDFAQRAMRHFVEDVQAVQLPLEEAKAAVQHALSRFTLRLPVTRVRVGDEQLLGLLRENWSACNGQSSRLLRFLRDKALVQCEQSRFRRLWVQVRTELANEGAG